MKLFATLHTDEDVSRLVATLLRVRGFDVKITSEQGMSGQLDRQQLAYAASVDRCSLTHNRVDFERLHLEYMTEGWEHSGIIVIPQKNAYICVQRSRFEIGDRRGAISAKETRFLLMFEFYRRV